MSTRQIAITALAVALMVTMAAVGWAAVQRDGVPITVAHEAGAGVVADHVTIEGDGTAANPLEIEQPYRLPQTCADTDFAQWNGTGWRCVGDPSHIHGPGGGNIAAIAAGDGISVGISNQTATITNTDRFTTADETKLNGIEAGAQVNPPHRSRFAAEDSDTSTGVSDGEMGLIKANNAILQSSESLSLVAAIEIPFEAAAIGQDATDPHTNLNAINLRPFFADVAANGGGVLLSMRERGTTNYAYAQAETISLQSDHYALGSLTWVDPLTLSSAGKSWDIVAARVAPVLLDHDTVGDLPYSRLSGSPTLAAVATSGAYSDLSGKPTIPAAQIQSDWDQTTTTALDFIKNKPTIPQPQNELESLMDVMAQGRVIEDRVWHTGFTIDNSNQIDISINNTNPPFGTADNFLGMYRTYNSSANAALLNGIVAGDVVMATDDAGTQWLVFRAAGKDQASGSDANIARVWFADSDVLYKHGLNEWDEGWSGGADVYVVKLMLDADGGNASDDTLDHLADHVTPKFKAAVQGSNEDESLGIFQRVILGLEQLGDNRFGVNGSFVFSVAVDASYQSDSSETNDAKLYRALKERAWIRFGNGYEIEVSALSERSLASGRAQYRVDTWKVIKGTPVGLNSSTSVTIIGEDVHRGQLTTTSFRLNAIGAAHRYARTDGSGDTQWETPATTITSATGKTLVTEGAVKSALETCAGGAVPATNGTYTCKATRTSQGVTYSWVSD